MGDIGSLTSLTGVNPTLDKTAHSARTAPPEPPTVQNAIAQPLNTPQAAVTQAPTADHAEWRREANPDDQRQQPRQPGAALTRQQLHDLLESLNQRLVQHQIPLRFEVDDAQEIWGVRIVDQETLAVVQRMTLADALAFARAFDDLVARQGQSAVSGNRLPIEGGLLRVTA